MLTHKSFYNQYQSKYILSLHHKQPQSNINHYSLPQSNPLNKSQLSNNYQSKQNQLQPDRSNPKIKDQPCVRIKDCKLKLKNLVSFSQNKLKKRKSSILSHIYKPRIQSKDDINNYFNIQNINLIKQNIKKLSLHLPKTIPSLLKNTSKSKFHINNSIKLQCKTQRLNRQFNNINNNCQQPVFLFHNNQLDIKQIFNKRKLSHHFDRSKYFKNQPLFQQPQHYHINSFIRRQKTQYRSNNSNLSKQKFIHSKIQQNQYINDDIVPIIKQKTNKPKTAGGFLKKYAAQGVCIRPDFELHLKQQDIF